MVFCFALRAVIFSAGSLCYALVGVLSQLSKESDGTYAYSMPAVVLTAEFVKLCLSFAFLASERKSASKACGLVLSTSTSTWLLYSVPSVLYAVNSNLDMLSNKYMDPATEQVLQQLKIITTEQTSIVVCLLNIDQALVYIGYAGLAIEGVHVDCAKDAEIADCSAVVSDIIASFSWSASFLFALASSCSTQGVLPAERLGTMTVIVAALADIAAGASAITQDCGGDYARIAYADNRGAEATACAFDGDFAGVAVAGAGLALRDAALDCPNREAKRECAINFGVIGASIASIAQYISLTATDCPKYINPRSACAADVASIVAAALELGAASTAMSLLLPPVQNLAPIIPFGRRLQEESLASTNMTSTVLGEDARGRSLLVDDSGNAPRTPSRLADLFMSWANVSGSGTVPKVSPTEAMLLLQSDLRSSVARLSSRHDIIQI